MEFFTHWIAPVILFMSIGWVVGGYLRHASKYWHKTNWQIFLWLLWFYVWYKISGGY